MFVRDLHELKNIKKGDNKSKSIKDKKTWQNQIKTIYNNHRYGFFERPVEISQGKKKVVAPADHYCFTPDRGFDCNRRKFSLVPFHLHFILNAS